MLDEDGLAEGHLGDLPEHDAAGSGQPARRYGVDVDPRGQRILSGLRIGDVAL